MTARAPGFSGDRALQIGSEIAWLAARLKRRGVHRFLEIGSCNGDGLHDLAAGIAAGGRILAVDLPEGPWGRKGSAARLLHCVETLRRRGFDAHAIFGDSHDPAVIHLVKSFGPYDAVLIDGDHSLAGAGADSETYGRPAPMVAFHDIAWRRARPVGRPIEVPALWRRLAACHPHESRIDRPGDCGIGILYPRGEAA
jgi:predicted O-methyltransferase YrrM